MAIEVFNRRKAVLMFEGLNETGAMEKVFFENGNYYFYNNL